MTTSLKRAFELEPLEPRVLLSANLTTGGIATATAAAITATNVTLTDAQQKELLNGGDAAVTYSPEAQVASIFADASNATSSPQPTTTPESQSAGPTEQEQTTSTAEVDSSGSTTPTVDPQTVLSPTANPTDVPST